MEAKTGLDFLRSAMDWRSKRIDTSTEEKSQVVVEEMSSNEVEGGEKEEVVPVEVEEEPDASAGETSAMEKKQYEVTYQCLPDVEETVEDEAVKGLAGRRPMQYLDVLLQTDEHGLGLNVGVEKVDEEQGSCGQSLVVQSFRRLSAEDIGPAEACGKIRVGDILHAVDGEEVRSLQQLQTKLKGRLGKRRTFVLLRFLRSLAVCRDSEVYATTYFDRRRGSGGVNETKWSDVDAVLHDNPQMATLLRQLATTNQMLQDKLIASQLKLEEQNIQLEQLHALYARTQAEGLPLFSLSKSIRPFSRKTSCTYGDDIFEKPIPTKIQTEVIEAVNAEYARLRQEFQLQYVLDKRELERKFAERAKKLEKATAKKVEMLVAGFQQALQHYADGHYCHCHSAPMDATDLDGDCAVLREGNHVDKGQHADTGSVKFVESVVQMKEEQILRRVLELLAKYGEIKHARLAKLQAPNSVTVDTRTPELKVAI